MTRQQDTDLVLPFEVLPLTRQAIEPGLYASEERWHLSIIGADDSLLDSFRLPNG